MDVELDLIAMFQGIGGNFQLPDVVGRFLQTMRIAVPLVELANQRNGLCPRQPFADDPVFLCRIEMNPEKLMRVAEGGERAVVLLNFFEGAFEASGATHDGIGLRLKPRIVLNKFWGIRHREEVVTLDMHREAKCKGQYHYRWGNFKLGSFCVIFKFRACLRW